ncbi:MAG: tRNA (guanosine(37)-N1)-methyltransferase TrmD [Pseudomonadota bacterium]
MWRADVITLYPEMFPGSSGHSLAGKAKDKLWSLNTVQLRNFGSGKHRAVDDTPAGGGPGMVIRADVAAAALDSIPNDNRPRLIMTPRAKPLQQSQIRTWSAGEGLVIFCPRFEGIDERIIAARGLIPVSIGDYVLSGGETAALVVLEACLRLIPGVMGKEASGTDESFENGLLEYAQFTRPADFEGQPIPDVLQSGNHAEIARWRQADALETTKRLRPDLLEKA